MDELSLLRIRDVNLLHCRVEVRRTLHRVKGGWEIGTPKSARSVRDVPFGRSLSGELAEYIAQHPRLNEPEAPLCPGRVPGGNGDVRLLDYDRQFDVSSVIRYYFKPPLAQLGITGVRWHDLRHFYASVCAAGTARRMRHAGGVSEGIAACIRDNEEARCLALMRDTGLLVGTPPGT